MESARKKFEAEREKILSEVPAGIKAMFGTIGFAESEADEDEDNDDENNASEEVQSSIIPVLILSPYDVPPKPVRDVYWFDLFSKNKRSKSLDTLPYLVYHYGADDPDDCYSFIEHEDFISYETGCAQGLHVLPPALDAKVRTGHTLTDEEARRVRGLQEMSEDAPKDPSDRKRGNEGFKERHELLQSSTTKKPPAKRQKK